MAQSGTDGGWGRRDKTEIQTNAAHMEVADTVVIYDPENPAAWVQSDYSTELPGGDE